jgi:ribose transport system permease protein
MSEELTGHSKFMHALGAPMTRALIALLLVVVLGFIFNADGAFLKSDTHWDMLRQASVYGMLACGMTLVIISGGIDLAVGSVLALAAVTFSLLTIHFQMSPWMAIPISIMVGGACGAASGAATTVLKVQPFIATLAMMVFARGMAKYVSGGMIVSTAVRQEDGTYRPVETPAVFNMIDKKVLGDTVSVVSLLFLGCVALAALLLALHRWGRAVVRHRRERGGGAAVGRAGGAGEGFGVRGVGDVRRGGGHLPCGAGATGRSGGGRSRTSCRRSRWW